MPTALVPFLSSFVLGALHSLEPGHGKSIIALHSSRSKKLSDGITMLFSLLITHFTLVMAIALTFYFIPSIQNVTFVTIISPCIILCYGIFLLIKNAKKPDDYLGCSCSHTEEENTLHSKKEQISAGILAGLTPCPSVFSPLIISMSTNSFNDIFSYIFAYVLGVIAVFVLIYLLFYVLGARSNQYFNTFTRSFNPHIFSGAIMIAIGMFYLAIHFLVKE